MSITKLICKATIVLAGILLATPMLHAQRLDQPLFIEPLEFNPDYQFFAPVDLGDFGEKPDHRTGWYAQYHRLHTFINRPASGATGIQGDFTWGNVYDIGFMTETGSGWSVTGTHIGGPNVFSTVMQPRINRINDDDAGNVGGDPDDLEPIFPFQDRNDFRTNSRVYFLKDSINVANMTGFEFNKTWRLEPFNNGSVLEPFMGLRYFKLKAFHRRDTYITTDETFVDNPDPNETDVLENYTSTVGAWENDMVGGQLGLRWVERRGRWTMSSHMRGFGAQNFQAFDSQIDTVQTLYDGVAAGADVVSESYTRTRTGATTSEFVFGYDVRAEAAFELTRDIALSAGVHVSQIVRGIGRSDDVLVNDEGFTTAGLLIGLNVNR
ncbi:MAG: hypothetical protein VB878_21185 [Pirellulaceae bacterium]